MTRQRVLLSLYLIGLFRATLYVTILLKIQILTIFQSGRISDGIFDMVVYRSTWDIFVELSIIFILYRVSNIESNTNLTNIHNQQFLRDISIYSLFHTLGYLTLVLGLIIIKIIFGIDTANNFNNDVLNIFGLIDIGYVSTGLLDDGNLKYLVASTFTGLSLTIFPILVLITSNLFHTRSQSNDDEMLYPVK